MKIHLNEAEIAFLDNEKFKLTSHELKTIMVKKDSRNQLLFAVMLQYYKIKLAFPETHNALVSYLSQMMADEIKTEPCFFHEMEVVNHRTVTRFRQAIRKILGFRESTDSDSINFVNWLVHDHLSAMPKEHQTTDAIRSYYQKEKMESFSEKQQQRYLESAKHQFETQIFKKVNSHLSQKNREFIDIILNRAIDEKTDEKKKNQEINLNTLKKGIPGAKLKHVEFAVKKYEAIGELWLPESITTGLSRKILLKYYDRIMAYSPSHIKELDVCAKYAMVAIFCHIRTEFFADSLSDLFGKFVRRIKNSSELHVDKTLRKEINRVEGKFEILCKLTETSLDYPDGLIKDKIYSVVDIETLKRLKEDLNQRGNWYKKQIRKKMRSLYSLGSRTELLDLLSFLKFDTQDKEGKDLIDAIDFIVKNRNNSESLCKIDASSSLTKVIPKDWLDFVVEHPVISVKPEILTFTLIQLCFSSEIAEKLKNSNETLVKEKNNDSDVNLPEKQILLKKERHTCMAILTVCRIFLSGYYSILNSQLEYITRTQPPIQINKLNYELVICTEIRKKLNYKGIWIRKSYRYRNPKKDLPPDFENNKVEYYKKLGLPMDVHAFIKLLKQELTHALSSLNKTILSNDKVSLLSKKNGGHIKISPSFPQKEPTHIIELQNEIIKRWGYINLIDAFKEANIRIGFTRHLETFGKYSNLDPDDLVMRLLLCIYAIGTNTGLKRISISNPDANESELHYVKRRHINSTNIRLAIREVINSVIKIRDPAIWGESTTTVACDSKKLAAWDQNLMNEFHARYKGHGIMVYWHVDTNALCIHSQSKTCTSSEVGSMIKGILDHNTDMDLDAAYVDTHGQSTIGFGIGKLLNFEILPRLKNIHKQKLYTVSDEDKISYENLNAILSDNINWKHIEDHYVEAIKHVSALKTGQVEADVFVKQFSRDNYKHPVYKALCEIGKVAKTIFLCDYLEKEELRIEINAGLNVVERLNSVMNFFFYGKLGEVNSNDPEEQELSILCLHLLQACAVYINTLLIQEILSDPVWRDKFTHEDYRALSPLIHSHFNPYGTFLLDLAKRLMINIEDFINDSDTPNTSERESKTAYQAAEV